MIESMSRSSKRVFAADAGASVEYLLGTGVCCTVKQDGGLLAVHAYPAVFVASFGQNENFTLFVGQTSRYKMNCYLVPLNDDGAMSSNKRHLLAPRMVSSLAPPSLWKARRDLAY